MASDQTTVYREINAFVQSIRGHRAQALWPSPYISVFDDIEEAKLLCLSLESYPCESPEQLGTFSVQRS